MASLAITTAAITIKIAASAVKTMRLVIFTWQATVFDAYKVDPLDKIVVLSSLHSTIRPPFSLSHSVTMAMSVGMVLLFLITCSKMYKKSDILHYGRRGLVVFSCLCSVVTAKFCWFIVAFGERYRRLHVSVRRLF